MAYNYTLYLYDVYENIDTVDCHKAKEVALSENATDLEIVLAAGLEPCFDVSIDSTFERIEIVDSENNPKAVFILNEIPEWFYDT